jgi:hypothetical protein
MTITKRTAIVLTIALYVAVGAVFGIIVGHFNTACENHGTVFYRFEVGGHEYAGVGDLLPENWSTRNESPIG